jgi:hypothetical protein
MTDKSAPKGPKKRGGKQSSQKPRGQKDEPQDSPANIAIIRPK